MKNVMPQPTPMVSIPVKIGRSQGYAADESDGTCACEITIYPDVSEIGEIQSAPEFGCLRACFSIVDGDACHLCSYSHTSPCDLVKGTSNYFCSNTTVMDLVLSQTQQAVKESYKARYKSHLLEVIEDDDFEMIRSVAERIVGLRFNGKGSPKNSITRESALCNHIAKLWQYDARDLDTWDKIVAMGEDDLSPEDAAWLFNRLFPNEANPYRGISNFEEVISKNPVI